MQEEALVNKWLRQAGSCIKTTTRHGAAELRFSTMESSRRLAVLGAAVLLLLGVHGQEETEVQQRALDLYSTVEDTSSHENELVGPPSAHSSRNSCLFLSCLSLSLFRWEQKCNSLGRLTM